MNFPFPMGTGLIVADPINIIQRFAPAPSGAALDMPNERHSKAFVPALTTI